MKTKKILTISCSISILGIFLLIILSNLIQPDYLKIEKITEDHLNKKIKISGEITSIKNYKNQKLQVLTIQNNERKIEIILNHPANLSKNQNISAVGTLQKYKNKLQINAEKISEN